MNILVIGGGISGVSAAKVALQEGNTVTILESAQELGGTMARIANCRIGFKTFLDEIIDNPLLKIIREGVIRTVNRDHDGSFIVTLEDGGSIPADRIVVAAGLEPFDPIEYRGKRVLTSLEYDSLIDQRKGELPDDFDKVAFVLCVGSRSKEYPLCSSVCCSYTLREVKWTLQRAKPELTVFYNDLRFFGQEFYLEQLYRDAGVRFIRANSRYFEEDETGVTVRYFAGDEVKEERFNYVVLAVGLRPSVQLETLSRILGFALNKYGFVAEREPLTTTVEGIFVSGGALEPMNIKDSILTGFGAGLLALRGNDFPSEILRKRDALRKEDVPLVTEPEGEYTSCLFYLGSDNPPERLFYEFMSGVFTHLAREMNRSGKTVYVVTRNVVMPSYAELKYEEARKEGVNFVHLEETDRIELDERSVTITGMTKDVTFNVDRIVRFEDYRHLFTDKEFLSLYRSEPQLRWSPTKWSRKRYHVGFIRHPREERWEPREILGALGEMLLDTAEERLLPEVNEERCSGCGSCKDACPHTAIEIVFKETPLAIFGPQTVSAVPIAHVKQDTCVGCGLCTSTCPSDSIAYPEK
ncbi:MAG TPA: FAD-dependent oxidoreductase [Oculatellaceae cyanobacterium]